MEDRYSRFSQLMQRSLRCSNSASKRQALTHPYTTYTHSHLRTPHGLGKTCIPRSSSSWTMTRLTTCNPPIVTRTLLRRVSIMGKSITHHRKLTACENNSIAVTVKARTLPENAHQLGVTPVIHARSLIQPRLAKPTAYPPMGITATEEADVGEAEAEADAVVAAEVAGVSRREPNLLLHQPQLINPRRVAT
jgi:hypothetical protein